MRQNLESYAKTAGLQVDKLLDDVVGHIVSVDANCSPMDAVRAALTKQLGKDYVDDKLIAVLGISYGVLKDLNETAAKCAKKINENK